MRTAIAVPLALALGAGTAAPVRADEKPPEPFTGVVTYGVGSVTGRVTSTDGKPLARAAVHIVSGSGETVVHTDTDGRFRGELVGGTQSIVWVRDEARIVMQTVVPAGEAGHEMEVVEIHEVLPPSVTARALSSQTTIPEYSDEARDSGAWTRAWLLLAVSETGEVTRMKVLKQPGHGLNTIAMREGFKLRFEPARDRSNHPIPSLAVWGYEWPSYTWMREHFKPPTRLPDDLHRVPCAGSGGTHTMFRDCSEPDLAIAVSRPWIDRAVIERAAIDKPPK